MSKLIILGADFSACALPKIYPAALAKVGGWDVEVVSAATAEEAVAAIQDTSWDAAIVRDPYKAMALRAATKAETGSQAAGGAGLLIRKEEEGVLAFNAEGTAVVATLARNGLLPQKMRVAVLGTSSTARAIIYALSCAGVKQVAVFAADKDTAVKTAQSTCTGVFAQTYEDGEEFLKVAECIIDATAMDAQPAAEAPFDVAIMDPESTLVVARYGKMETPLAQAQAARGGKLLMTDTLACAHAALNLQTLLTVIPGDGERLTYFGAMETMQAALNA